MALAVSVAELWALSSTPTTRPRSRSTPSSARRRAAVVTCRFHEAWARDVLGAAAARTRALQASCGDVVLRWSRRLARRFASTCRGAHPGVGRVFFRDVARRRARRPARADDEHPLYQYAGEKGATRGGIPARATRQRRSWASPSRSTQPRPPLPSAALAASRAASRRDFAASENAPRPEDTTTRPRRARGAAGAAVAARARTPARKRTIERRSRRAAGSLSEGTTSSSSATSSRRAAVGPSRRSSPRRRRRAAAASRSSPGLTS